MSIRSVEASDHEQSLAGSSPSPKSGLGGLMRDPVFAAQSLFVESSSGPTPHLHALCLQIGERQVLCGEGGPSHPLPRTCLGQSALAELGGCFPEHRAPVFGLALYHPLGHLHSWQPAGPRSDHRQKPSKGGQTCPRAPSCRAAWGNPLCKPLCTVVSLTLGPSPTEAFRSFEDHRITELRYLERSCNSNTPLVHNVLSASSPRDPLFPSRALSCPEPRPAHGLSSLQCSCPKRPP